VKSVSELYCPVSGEVTEVNSALAGKPELVNTDPHGAWMIALEIADPNEPSDLLDAASYEKLTT
jgi:glycine cleavage system H protein